MSCRQNNGRTGVCDELFCGQVSQVLFSLEMTDKFLLGEG
jgi:hypothetical protein